jgi:hypothetical protein
MMIIDHSGITTKRKISFFGQMTINPIGKILMFAHMVTKPMKKIMMFDDNNDDFWLYVQYAHNENNDCLPLQEKFATTIYTGCRTQALGARGNQFFFFRL